jgi:hypothetical protein
MAATTVAPLPGFAVLQPHDLSGDIGQTMFPNLGANRSSFVKGDLLGDQIVGRRPAPVPSQSADSQPNRHFLAI